MANKNPVLGLAFNVKNPDEAIVKMLQDEFKAKQIDENMWAFPYDPAVGDYDKFADILGSFYVGIINATDYVFYRDDRLNQDMLDFSGEDPEEDGSIPLTVLPDVEDFTVDNADDIKAAIEEVRNQYYQVTVDWDGSDQRAVLGDKKNPEVTNDDVVNSDNESQNNWNEENPDNSKNDTSLTENHNGSKQTNNVEHDDSDKGNDDHPVEDVIGDIFNEGYQDQTGTQQDNSTEHVKGKPDFALTLAADIFENNEPLVLQGFDDATRQQIAPDYIKAQANVGNKADESIFEMAQRIRNANEKFEDEFKERFKDSTDQHNETLEKIATKADQDFKKAEKDNKEAYQKAKDEYVKANRPRLEAEFDDANRGTYARNLDNQRADIEANAHKLNTEEKKRYQEAFNKQSAQYVERRIRQMDFSDIYDAYEETLRNETDHLAEIATSFTDQVAVVTKHLVDEKKGLERQNEALSKENDVLNRTMEKQTDAKAEKIASDRTVALQQQLSDSKLTNSSLQEKLNELQAKNDELERDNRSLKRTQSDLLKAKETAESLLPAKQNVVEVQRENLQPAPEKSVDKKKSGHINTIVGLIAGILIATGLGAGYLAWEGQHQAKNSTQHQTIQVVPNSSSSSNSHEYSKGDTFNYHSDKDNKDYTVTMDNSTQGHYTDSKGNYHQVTLKEGD